jgi:hypothetical protein
MHFLKIFFRFIAIGIVLALVGVLAGREIWLYYGGAQVARQAQRITQQPRFQKFYGNCRGGLELEGELPFRGIQLRFLNASTFVSEIDCVSQVPFEVERFQLPMGVKKTTGSAGFFYDTTNQVVSGEVTLEFLGQSRVVFVDGLKSGQQWGKSFVQSSLPVSQCSGHGLKCCDAVESQGEGLPMTAGVLDCPGSCYNSCLRRPVLLSFQTDPSFSEARVVELQEPDNLVIFAYTFDDQEASLRDVTIDFGDGTTESSTLASGTFEKAYVCSSAAGCEYVVQIRATDTRDVVSADTRLSTLRVVLNPDLNQ